LKLKERIALRLIKIKSKKQSNQTNIQPPNSLKTDGFAIAGFVGSLIGFSLIILLSNPFALIAGSIFGILAIAFSLSALKRIRLEPERKKGKILALLGLFLGGTLLLISIIGGIGYLM